MEIGGAEQPFMTHHSPSHCNEIVCEILMDEVDVAVKNDSFVI